ncbi:MAG: hypothetical protein ABIP54_04035 [Candidatus Andersenbacteria bacterium]
MKIKGYSITVEFIIGLLSVVLNAFLWILVLATFPKHDPSAILHYTAGVGIDFVGSPLQIFVLPGIGLAVLLINGLLARFVKSVSSIAFWIFWASLPILELMLLGVYIILLRLNS